MSDKYDKSKITRNDIDDYAKRNTDQDSYKNRQFAGKRTMQDEYTGKKIHYSQTSKGTINGNAIANTDHITPIEKIRERYGNDLSTQELKEIANSDANLAMTQQRLNQSKGAKTNLEYVFSQVKKGQSVDAITTYNMLKKQVQSEVVLSLDANSRQIINRASDTIPSFKSSMMATQQSALRATNAGIDTAIVTLTIASINNIAACASGRKTVKEAGKEILDVTGSSFVSGAGVDIMQQTAQHLAVKTGSNALKSVASKGLPIAEITATVMVGNSILKYANGEINSEECVAEILMSGAGVAAYTLGMSLGGPAGAVIASVVCSQICETIAAYKRKNKLNEEKLSAINSITTQALYNMEVHRNVLRTYIQEEYKKWDENIDSGFESIFAATISNDVEGISRGLNEILSILGKTTAFSSEKEFNTFFDNDEAVFVL